MPNPDHAISLEEQIDQWRSYLRRRQAIHSVDVAELEDHLREQVTGLMSAGLAADERNDLLRAIPPTEIVQRDAADDLWRRRKSLFFKPVDGYGSKAAYRGDKLTRSTFEHILSHRYVAQALVPTSLRRVTAEGEATDLRVDVRNYAHRGATWLRAARLYRGQATNFRTPGGGFAPVLSLRTGLTGPVSAV